MHKENSPDGKRPEDPPKAIRAVDLMRLLNFGWYFGGCVVVGVVAGLFLDRWLDTKPWFLLGGLLLGSIAGFYGMFKMLLPLYQAGRGTKRKPGDRK